MRYTQGRPSLARRGKTRCPQCGRKTFVNYIYPDGTPVADGECGKCDRADHCAYHMPPRQWNALHRSPSAPVRHEPPRPLQPSFMPTELMARSLGHYERNPLARFLHGVFDPHLGADRVDSVLMDYGLGTSALWGGAAVFWQVDHLGRVRTGKVIGYDPLTGHRIHDRNTWVHALPTLRRPDFNLRQAYFGAHLMRNVSGNPTILLFESEKGALITALLMHLLGCERTFIPMACGGCAGFNPSADLRGDPWDKHQVLRGRRVALFPDQGKYEEWDSRRPQLQGWAACCSISRVMERPQAVEVAPGDGFDDLILRHLASPLPLDALVTLFNRSF